MHPKTDSSLPAQTAGQVEGLRALSDRAEGGDKEARRELRKQVRSAAPELITRISDTTRRRQRLLIKTIAANDPLIEEGLEARLDLMREEIAGEDPTPLEVLLTERIVALWLLVELFEVLMSAQLTPGNDKRRVPLAFLKHYLQWQERVNRRYLAAIRELARVRKLQANTPIVQFNTQRINVRRPLSDSD